MTVPTIYWDFYIRSLKNQIGGNCAPYLNSSGRENILLCTQMDVRRTPNSINVRLSVKRRNNSKLQKYIYLIVH